jgi:hypothetical protein
VLRPTKVDDWVDQYNHYNKVHKGKEIRYIADDISKSNHSPSPSISYVLLRCWDRVDNQRPGSSSSYVSLNLNK